MDKAAKIQGKLQDSIFFKLFMVFTLAAAADIGVMHFFYRHIVYDNTRRMHRSRNMAEYGGYLAAQLGYPPSQGRIDALARDLHLRIRVEGPGVSAESSADVPGIAEVGSRLSLRYADSRSRVGKFHDFLAIVRDSPPGHYLFLLESEDVIEEHSRLIIGLAAILVSILLLAYFAVRWILRPIRSIERGVREVAGGNLDFSIQLDSRDEMGRLARLFNDMTLRVRAMIDSKERLLLDMSHEFRSPLTRIKVALELPEAEGRGSIHRSVRELETMISELLETARLNDAQGRLKIEQVDLRGLLADMILPYQDERPGVRLGVVDERRGDPQGREARREEPIIVAVDPARIRTAIRNVLENAVKYSCHQDRPVEVKLERQGGHKVGVSIQDFGIGIAPEDQERVFEPFYRVDRSRVKATGGYGLGLSLCRKILEAHQGTIRVSSISGKETLFYIELPC